MTPIELLFNRPGEYTVLIKIQENDAQGFYENLNAAKFGGKNARKAYEDDTGVKVVSPKKCLPKNEKSDLIDGFEKKMSKIADNNARNS